MGIFGGHFACAPYSCTNSACKDTRKAKTRGFFSKLMISEAEDILWVSKMLGHKSSDITLKTYARAYKLSDDKEKRKKRALFLEKGPSLGIVNNMHYLKARNIGVQK